MRRRSSRSSSSDADGPEPGEQPTDGPDASRHERCARAVIEYDGTAFAGSQYQPNARTVQGELEKALNRLTGERTRVRFAGRTDAGVHATGQVAAFCLPRRRRGEGYSWPALRRAAERRPAAGPGGAVAPSGASGIRPAARRQVARVPLPDPDGGRSTAGRSASDARDRRPAGRRRHAGRGGLAARGARLRRPGQRRARSNRSAPAEVRIVQRGTSVEIRVTANAFLRRMVRSIVALAHGGGPRASSHRKRSSGRWRQAIVPCKGAPPRPGADTRAGHLFE